MMKNDINKEENHMGRLKKTNPSGYDIKPNRDVSIMK
jgi:hypothetical protein